MTKSQSNRIVRRGRIFPEIQWTQAQQAQWQAEHQAFRQRCQEIFNHIKPVLMQTHYNCYIAVEPDSGEYFVDAEPQVASLQCRQKYPGKIPHIFRINETGACGTI